MPRRANEASRASVPVLTPVDRATRRDGLVRVMALALPVVVAVVPAAVAIFYAVTRRLGIADGVFTAASPTLARLPEDWARSHARPGFTDPFAPSRVADIRSPVIGVDDVSGRDAFAHSPYGRLLASYGLDDQIGLYAAHPERSWAPSHSSEAVALAKLHGPEAVEQALTAAAHAERFGDGDLAAILAHHQGGQLIAFPRASEQQSLQRSTRAWEGFGA